MNNSFAEHSTIQNTTADIIWWDALCGPRQRENAFWVSKISYIVLFTRFQHLLGRDLRLGISCISWIVYAYQNVYKPDLDQIT